MKVKVTIDDVELDMEFPLRFDVNNKECRDRISDGDSKKIRSFIEEIYKGKKLLQINNTPPGDSDE